MAEVLAAGVKSSVRAGGGASVKLPPGGGRVAGAFPCMSANCVDRDGSRIVCLWGYDSRMGWDGKGTYLLGTLVESSLVFLSLTNTAGMAPGLSVY